VRINLVRIVEQQVCDSRADSLQRYKRTVAIRYQERRRNRRHTWIRTGNVEGPFGGSAQHDTCWYLNRTGSEVTGHIEDYTEPPPAAPAAWMAHGWRSEWLACRRCGRLPLRQKCRPTPAEMYQEGPEMLGTGKAGDCQSLRDIAEGIPHVKS